MNQVIVKKDLLYFQNRFLKILEINLIQVTKKHEKVKNKYNKMKEQIIVNPNLENESTFLDVCEELISLAELKSFNERLLTQYKI